LKFTAIFIFLNYLLKMIKDSDVGNAVNVSIIIK